MDRDAIVEALRNGLRGRADVRVALLFGSVARDRTHEGSDIDVAVLAPDVDRNRLAADLALACGADVDVVDLRTATIPLVEALVRDGIVVHEGARGAAATWRSGALAMLETDGPWYRRMCDAWLARQARSLAGG